MGPQQALKAALEQARQRVAVVWNMLPNATQLTKEHQALAEGLAEVARDIRDHLRKKLED